MNEKTRAQIEAMKNQTIGVEVEMNNITREKAAKKIAKFFGTTECELYTRCSEYPKSVYADAGSKYTIKHGADYADIVGIGHIFSAGLLCGTGW